MHPAYVRGYANVITKFAAVSEEDISMALTGNKPRDIAPEEIQEYAQQRQQEALADASHRPYVGAGIGGGLGALLGTAAGKHLTDIGGDLTGRALGGGVGALAGAGLGLGIGALSRHVTGKGAKRWGTTLGEIAQEGRVPRHMPHRSHEALPPTPKASRKRRPSLSHPKSSR